MTLYQENKQTLKDLADFIKSKRGNKKAAQRLAEREITEETLIESSFFGKSRWGNWLKPDLEFRIRHVAASEFRGKPREQIEKPRECNRLFSDHEKKIEELKGRLEEEREAYAKQKALCPSEG